MISTKFIQNNILGKGMLISVNNHKIIQFSCLTNQIQWKFAICLNPGAEWYKHCTTRFWVPFPNDTAYALANYGHSCTTPLESPPPLFLKALHEKIKSCNLHLGFYWMHSEFNSGTKELGDHGSTVVKVLRYKLEGLWFDPSWCQWIFHWHKILPIVLWPWGRLSL